ncbi:sugar phosphate isomerase/epimerase family protein [Poriferisphaera sp. WC338]|uniref:sugar phosphate isomerase/epimerase family protein n=1 Tax=Poriferisphaera sp. WC338 TaxID=3425129 RepID=UPI003D814FB6
MPQAYKNSTKLAVHTMTNKPWTLRECIEAYAARNIHGISVWRNVLEGIALSDAATILNDHNMVVPALVRGGFFPSTSVSGRQKALDENRSIIDEAAAINAEMVVYVVGAVPNQRLDESRKQTQDAFAAILPHAEARNIKLAIEPLHPMYAADRSCINRMAEARHICEQLNHPLIGIAADVFHIWWDADVEKELCLAAVQKTLFGFHICDWKPDMNDMLNDRGLMGDGCIDLAYYKNLMNELEFDGYHEVEVFSDLYWRLNQDQYLDMIVQRAEQYAYSKSLRASQT